MTKADHHFYGRRKGKPLHKGRTESLGVVQSDFSIPENILEQKSIEPCNLFGSFSPEAVWLEIGFGNGEHLVNQALLHKDAGIIGCEPFINGVAAAAKEVVAQGIKNIRFYSDDALPLLTRFPAESLDKIFLLFPDPWPKTRHHKRRFIQKHTVELFAKLLKPGGQLRLATDDRNLADWMLLHTVLDGRFSWNNREDAQCALPPLDWVETRYQQKAAQQGRLAHFLNFTRI